VFLEHIKYILCNRLLVIGFKNTQLMHLIFNKKLCLNDSFFAKIMLHGAEVKIGIGNNTNLKFVH
jgi:hypothetical protein